MKKVEGWVKIENQKRLETDDGNPNDGLYAICSLLQYMGR